MDTYTCELCGASYEDVHDTYMCVCDECADKIIAELVGDSNVE